MDTNERFRLNSYDSWVCFIGVTALNYSEGPGHCEVVALPLFCVWCVHVYILYPCNYRNHRPQTAVLCSPRLILPCSNVINIFLISLYPVWLLMDCRFREFVMVLPFRVVDRVSLSLYYFSIYRRPGMA